MTQKPANPDTPITPQGIYLTIVLVLVALAVNLDAIHRRHVRMDVFEKEAAREAAERDSKQRLALLTATSQDASADFRTLLEQHVTAEDKEHKAGHEH